MNRPRTPRPLPRRHWRRPGRLRLVGLSLVLATTACSGSGAVSPDITTTSTFPAVTPEPQACDGPVDTPIDVAGEPDWRQYEDYVPWTDRDGCLIRVDVLAERPGPAACGWEDTSVLISGVPLGVQYLGTFDSIEFVRDPSGSYGIPDFVAGFDLLENLPADAIDTNYRQSDRELWLSPTDPNAVYLRSPEGTERWPIGEVPVCQ